MYLVMSSAKWGFWGLVLFVRLGCITTSALWMEQRDLRVLGDLVGMGRDTSWRDAESIYGLGDGQGHLISRRAGLG